MGYRLPHPIPPPPPKVEYDMERTPADQHDVKALKLLPVGGRPTSILTLRRKFAEALREAYQEGLQNTPEAKFELEQLKKLRDVTISEREGLEAEYKKKVEGLEVVHKGKMEQFTKDLNKLYDQTVTLDHRELNFKQKEAIFNQMEKALAMYIAWLDGSTLVGDDPKPLFEQLRKAFDQYREMKNGNVGRKG